VSRPRHRSADWEAHPSAPRNAISRPAEAAELSGIALSAWIRERLRRTATRELEDTFVALDPDTKLVPSYLVGKRSRDNAVEFIFDLSNRLTNRVQISSDSLRSYVDAVERAFGADVDYGQIVKFFDAEPTGPARYAPPQVTHVEKTVIAGSPDPVHISTSLSVKT
jgi:hypothetical protein